METTRKRRRSSEEEEKAIQSIFASHFVNWYFPSSYKESLSLLLLVNHPNNNNNFMLRRGMKLEHFLANKEKLFLAFEGHFDKDSRDVCLVVELAHVNHELTVFVTAFQFITQTTNRIDR